MWVECVPNLSEGRDPAVIEALCAAAASVPGAALLDRHVDPDHHRTVLTIAGTGRAVAEAAFRVVRVAVERIDLRGHDGVHPRIGSADVVPFVPLRGTSWEEAQEVARGVGERLAEELELPVYWYARSARRPERRRLPWLRAPRFEGLGEALASEERAPDVGPARPHPSAGATAVGVRGFLLAYNVDLEGGDRKAARAIARGLREAGGGKVQALGLELPRQSRVQVSTNLLDPTVLGPGWTYGEVARRAEALGAKAGGSELVGLIPRAVVQEGAERGLRFVGGLGGRVLEDRLEAEVADPSRLEGYLERVGRRDPTGPGGGSAAALALALGRACLDKVAAHSEGVTVEGVGSWRGFLDLASEDHEAFAALMQAYRLGKGEGRKAALRAARGPAVEVPLRALAEAVALAEEAARLAEVGNSQLVNDAVAAAQLALAAGHVGRLNATVNVRGEAPAELAEGIARLERAAARARAAAE